ncbi:MULTISPECIES: N-acetylneuraminate synthase family protein [unclassified Leptolyngbya]|uniref:cytidylyltransferase domain-containing protein n=1 Tax=unclassified Leptolyngbya TaxID=2650499 RepID=UPI001689ED06|nr:MULTISPECIES: N-acetylneuraminate synthase family protein [unclassified Leptolyngbya]MBD1912365.1 N-acetylneuraminate synthase family protein [Leptolyngbya sp. FACHB-8]MBD2157999.1 N-acetylneuraminate synthase family protein [Leptolyngbya sp. FACHB-16]
MPYNIIEFANTHGGDHNYAIELVRSFQKYTKGFGIKFQAFHPDFLATENYQWYEVYKKLFFYETQWEQLIREVAQTKDVWLDIFDSYSVQILKNNFQAIYGIKFQASILYNYSLIKEITALDLSSKKLILNIASFTLDEIDEITQRFKRDLQPEELLLEVGFQAYPTQIEDSGIGKIKAIKQCFNCRVVFADHADGTTEDSIWLPIMAMMQGADVLEKHVMLADRETPYDYFSSITPEKYDSFIEKQFVYAGLAEQPFINAKEREYLQKTLMIPFLKTDVPAGKLLALSEDLVYKRSDKTGLSARQIKSLQDTFHILGTEKVSGDAFYSYDFKKAKIATIVACRLKSSRLPKKALLTLGDLTSVEFCLRNALKFQNVHHTILATSDLESDMPLKDYLFSSSVIFYQGHPEDVIQRYLGVAQQLKIDIIIRVTADMPFIDNHICQLLLKSHFENAADYTTASRAAVGTNLEIISVQTLEKIHRHFPTAQHAEYMTWYFQNNPEHFRLNFVDLPDELVRDYRLTLDYEEDLLLFNQLHQNFIAQGNVSYTLTDIFLFLDNNPNVASINSHKSLRYRDDNQLIALLNEETKIV